MNAPLTDAERETLAARLDLPCIADMSDADLREAYLFAKRTGQLDPPTFKGDLE